MHVCVCVCARVHAFVTYEDTNLYSDIMVWHKYYKENGIYENISPCPHNSKGL